jgi:hypothetical protein
MRERERERHEGKSIVVHLYPSPPTASEASRRRKWMLWELRWLATTRPERREVEDD